MIRRVLLALLLCPALVGAAEPGFYSPICRQGETFVRVIEVKDKSKALVDFTGYSAKLQIRQNETRALELELTSASGLTLGGAAGTVTWTMQSAQTTALPAGKHPYDLKLTSGLGTVSYLLYGYVVVREGVTQ